MLALETQRLIFQISGCIPIKHSSTVPVMALFATKHRSCSVEVFKLSCVGYLYVAYSHDQRLQSPLTGKKSTKIYPLNFEFFPAQQFDSTFPFQHDIPLSGVVQGVIPAKTSCSLTQLGLIEWALQHRHKFYWCSVASQIKLFSSSCWCCPLAKVGPFGSCKMVGCATDPIGPQRLVNWWIADKFMMQIHCRASLWDCFHAQHWWIRPFRACVLLFCGVH